MDRPYILHMVTPGKWMSPFDINMAADAGYELLPTYAEVTLEDIAGLTRDAIFSRGPKGVARTGVFVGGRDVILAADMLEAAREAMVQPFVVSIMADPSGAYTTAAALVACVEAQLKAAHATDLAGKTLVILGGTGPVGRIAGVLAHGLGAEVRIASRQGAEAAGRCADQTNARFGSAMAGVSSDGADALRAAIADADVVLATAAAGVQVLSEADRAAATRLLVAADLNAVPPEGIAGVGVQDNGKPLAGGQAVGIGALAVGNVKYQTEHRLLMRMRLSEKPLAVGFMKALATAREVLA